MKKWIMIGIAVLLIAAVVGLLIRQPWQDEAETPGINTTNPAQSIACPEDPTTCPEQSEPSAATINNITDHSDIKYAKPVIYLYPEQETEVAVSLDLDGQLTCTYPAYDGLWQVTAAPDGTLTDKNGQTYNYLYWEGLADMKYDFSQGFCVKGEDTAAFLEQALEALGLTRREANEFIVYWLPLMEANPYNIISFQQENYCDAARLEVTPAPDTVIRVFMAWQAAEDYVALTPQDLSAPERNGFTVVEWGGTDVSKADS